MKIESIEVLEDVTPMLCPHCRAPKTRNPHPDAGKPSHLSEAGYGYECIPCLVRLRSSWASRALAAEKRVCELESDGRRLDWIEAQAAEGMDWLARQSSTGRGFRLHQGTAPGATTARAAIDMAREGINYG